MRLHGRVLCLLLGLRLRVGVLVRLSRARVFLRFVLLVWVCVYVCDCVCVRVCV